MDIYVAMKRVRFDIDEPIGVYSDRANAETAIIAHLIKAKNQRNLTSEELLFSLAASWEIDVWTVDSDTRKDSYGLTQDFLVELMERTESA